jgi:hypothetical protein
MSDLICPVCQTLIPVQRTQLPHDHVGADGQRATHKTFDVMAKHLYAKMPELGRCDGSGAIFDVPD